MSAITDVIGGVPVSDLDGSIIAYTEPPDAAMPIPE